MKKPTTEAHCVTMRPEQWEALQALTGPGGSVSAELRKAVDLYLKVTPRAGNFTAFYQAAYKS